MWKNYTKKVLNDLGNHNGVITYLEPNILECEVKWALVNKQSYITTNKASWSNGIPTELFKTLEGDAVKMLHSKCKQIWKTQ